MVRTGFFCFVCLVPQLALGRETVQLRNGYSFEAESHSENTGTVQFKVGSGTVQIAKADIGGIEAFPEIPPITAAGVNGSGAKDAEALLREAAKAQGLDEAFVRSVAKVESGLQQNAISVRGALGLMQLMPGTAAELKVDASRAGTNALGGAMYLRKLLLRYNGDSGLALAAYNAGPGAVKKYGGVPPYTETRQYILKVLTEYKRQLHTVRTKARRDTVHP